MKNLVRKTSAFFFVFLGALPFFITMAFTLREYYIQREMKKKLESYSLQTIVVPANEVVWMDDHEIFVNGYMFDIRTQTLSNGLYTFTGMYDEEETDLVIAQQKTHRSLTDNEQMIFKLLLCIRSLFIEKEAGTEDIFPVVLRHYDGLVIGSTQYSPPIHVPPPRMG